MRKQRHDNLRGWISAVALAMALSGITLGGFARAEAQTPPAGNSSPESPQDATHRETKNSECLDCHDGSSDEVTFEDGSSLSVTLDNGSWGKSAHGKRLTCTQCHGEISDYPHPESNAKSARA